MIKTNTTNIINQITKALKEERFRQNMSVAELSKLSGAKYGSIWHYENDRTEQITLPTLVRVAYVLKLDMSALFLCTKQKKVFIAQQFDTITQGLSKKSINMILEMTKDMADFCRY